MIGVLCSIIRETGVSDSGAAARASLHPSTVSRWKRDCPDLAILLRAAREEFRMAQLSIIMETAHAGRGTSWRAAAWLLERVFPEDYAPRARERALFQERFEAVCAGEGEGGAVALEEGGGADGEAIRQSDDQTFRSERNEGRPLQNVQNSGAAAVGADGGAARGGANQGEDAVSHFGAPEAARRRAPVVHLPAGPLQNVQNSRRAAAGGGDPGGRQD